MTALAGLLARVVGRPIVDRTALEGYYDLVLDFSTGMNAQQPGEPQASLFTARKEQLGLELLVARIPLETLVVERIERPTSN